jgi:hypothetical protein
VEPGDPLPDPEVVPEPELVVPPPVPELTGRFEAAEPEVVPVPPGTTALAAAAPVEPMVPCPSTDPSSLVPGVFTVGRPLAAGPRFAGDREPGAVTPPGRPPTTPADGALPPADPGADDELGTSPPTTGV